MLRLLLLFTTCWLTFWSSSYGQNYTSAKLKTVVFPHPTDNTMSFAPAAEAYLAKDFTSKFFYYGSFEYYKYFYLPTDYPARRPSFLGGLGFQNKNFSIRLGLGTGENLDYIGDLAIRIGNKIDRKDYLWVAEGGVRSGLDNVKNYGETLVFANFLYRLHDLLELGFAYNGKKIPTATSSHWWGPRIRSEVEENWYLMLEVQKWQKNIFGIIGVQIILI
jgi:hypothetical protein